MIDTRYGCAGMHHQWWCLRSLGVPGQHHTPSPRRPCWAWSNPDLDHGSPLFIQSHLGSVPPSQSWHLSFCGANSGPVRSTLHSTFYTREVTQENTWYTRETGSVCHCHDGRQKEINEWQNTLNLTCRIPAEWSEPWTLHPAVALHPSASCTFSAVCKLPGKHQHSFKS